MIFYFDGGLLDLERRELRRANVLCRVEPQVFDVLACLIRHRERVVSRQELMTAVWNGRIISEAAVDTRVSAARKAVGDTGAEQRLIRTLRTRGYRFVGWARRELSDRDTTHDPNGSTERKIPLDYPSIAVLPFDNFGGGPAQKHFADGIAQDLIAGLSKIGWLSVATSSASFSCKREGLDDAQITRKLGVRYLLTGCVRKTAGHMRISVQLADAIAQRQIWADSYDQEDGIGFVQNNQICARVITAIKPQLITEEHLRVQTKGEANLNDWECLIRALALMNTRVERNIIAAIGLLNRATILNPASARNYGLQSIANTLRVHMGWADGREVLPHALVAAHHALSLNPDEPWAHAALGYALIYQEPQTAIAPCERAVALNPNFAVGHYFLALASSFAGCGVDYSFAHADEAEKNARRDLLMRGYAGAYDNVRATACFGMERYLEGLEFARKAAIYVPNSPSAHRAVLINLALAGKEEAARKELDILKRVAPKMSRTWIEKHSMWSTKRINKRYIEAFRIAGLTR